MAWTGDCNWGKLVSLGCKAVSREIGDDGSSGSICLMEGSAFSGVGSIVGVSFGGCGVFS